MAKVVFTKLAKYDLLDIEYYIFVKLQNPQAARRAVDGILDVSDSLSEYPKRHALVKNSNIQQVGIRKVSFENYNIFYYYNDNSDIVYILRILYNRFDWKHIL